jgi:hypothetical protein
MENQFYGNRILYTDVLTQNNLCANIRTINSDMIVYNTLNLNTRAIMNPPIIIATVSLHAIPNESLI